MPRQNRRRTETPRPAAGLAGEQRATYRGQPFAYRSVAGSSAEKTYRCPGCDQVMAPGVPHVVAWPADDVEADDRRHWHRGCWNARDNRAPGVQRSRSAPRY